MHARTHTQSPTGPPTYTQWPVICEVHHHHLVISHQTPTFQHTQNLQHTTHGARRTTHNARRTTLNYAFGQDDPNFETNWPSAFGPCSTYTRTNAQTHTRTHVHTHPLQTTHNTTYASVTPATTKTSAITIFSATTISAPKTSPGGSARNNVTRAKQSAGLLNGATAPRTPPPTRGAMQGQQRRAAIMATALKIVYAHIHILHTHKHMYMG